MSSSPLIYDDGAPASEADDLYNYESDRRVNEAPFRVLAVRGYVLVSLSRREYDWFPVGVQRALDACLKSVKKKE
jgi:hypothetical protein